MVLLRGIQRRERDAQVRTGRCKRRNATADDFIEAKETC